MSIKPPGSAFDLIHKGQVGALLQFYITDHFGWDEVFANCSEREIRECPRAYLDNALKQAKVMEKVRLLFGKPIDVTSWYRDPDHNRRAKGATKSQHLLGLATDFTIRGLATKEGNKFVQEKLHTAEFMKFQGLEFTGGNWTHVDSRSAEDGKRYGYRFHL